LYAADAARWSGSESSAPSPQERLAAALDAVWNRWRSAANDGRRPSGRESFDVSGEPMTVLWQTSGGTVRALVGTAAFVEAAWLAPLAPILSEQHVSLALRDSTGKDVFGSAGTLAASRATRSIIDGALPWAVVTTTVDPPPEERAFAQRRRWLIAGFALMTTLALLATALIVGAVTRELAVARQQSDFVAAVSHEFRTPLTALRQFTDMLREQPALDDGRRHQAYAAQARATARLTRLVESLLDFGRMEAGVRSYHFATRDAAQFVGGVVDDFRAEPGATAPDIAFSGGDSAPIEIDEEAMTRAVRNLLENAVKYSPAPPRVEVALARRNGHVRISVRDRGLGIPAHERTRIFRKFQRGEQALARGIKGTGIGLAMVQEIVSAHRGRVDVESEAGQGSTFTIVLPAASAASHPPEAR
jgi:two-component system phosphate regulon sensor histidine kinase PhoR